ncbi:MAG: type I glutamate--ammonia ligase [Anaerolineae bacterium]|nr:type I glutamate--ammonia ligase [Anaerolineae bacterium]MCB0247138.1 type I glutamate--ammonia ligase [Anaerolineae bacterium]MCB9133634.1 type I glutamate--ammonia ligase [Anaerolineales bacterium]MCB9141162.1 type I glutamate--ammonia ligase [Anaerolineales bacterium]
MAKTVADVLALVPQVKMVDFRFTDLPGVWQHFSVPAKELTAETFEEGVGFDGSSIRGFKEIHESDMLLMLDAETAFIDPVLEVPTLAIVCDVYDPITRDPYSRDPRFIAARADAYLKQTGIGDTSFWGPEAEFFLFNNVRYGGGSNEAFYSIDSDEAWWNSGRADRQNLGAQIPPKRGYFPTPPTDTLQDVRSRIVMALEEAGIDIEVHHHEVATAGQCEIDMRFGPLLQMADSIMKYKYIVKNVARKEGLTATFMPKPIFGDNGSGMHVHQSVWKDGKNVFYDEAGYGQLSDSARFYIGGLLKHAPALLALCAPTTNSYRRLVPGFEAPVNLAYSQRNRSAICRIPVYSKSPKAKRIEFRAPDPSANPYLAFAAMLMAGIDGIQNRIDPGGPLDKDLYSLPPEEAKAVKQVPGSLEAVLFALEADHEFLLKGDVFTSDMLETYIAYKRENEVDPMRMRPHPHEFMMYFDV